jgi:hypothetical protein
MNFAEKEKKEMMELFMYRNQIKMEFVDGLKYDNFTIIYIINK